jgi:hypothetical protein
VRAEQAAITAYAPSLVSRSAVSGVCVVLLCIFLDSHVDCTPKFADWDDASCLLICGPEAWDFTWMFRLFIAADQ